MLRSFYLLLVFGLLSANNLFAASMPADVNVKQQANEVEVYEYLLNNGMKVLVKPDRRAPVATAQVWYKIGSADEYGGITGVSHVLEHMMFKGTEQYPVGEFSRILATVGARDNAFTSRDYTAYYQLLGSANLETSFKLESDRMQNLDLLEAEFLKEVEVVKEERRLRTDDNPNALVYEQLMATAYFNSPYGQPVIGWMDDLDNLTLKDISNWYRKWYSPNNATLVVVGDVDPQEILQLAKKYYGVIAAEQLPDKKPRIEGKQQGERRIQVEAPAKLPYLMIGYKVPVLATVEDPAEAYALDVLASILDGGSSARFAKELVRKQQLAASAGAGYDMHAARNSLFLFDGTPATGHSIEELEQAIYLQIERLKQQPISAKELERVKVSVIADEVYQQDSVQRQAYIIGALETSGLGWQRMQEFADGISNVTAEQVQAVANKYLIPSHRTVAVLKPQQLTASAPVRPSAH